MKAKYFIVDCNAYLYCVPAADLRTVSTADVHIGDRVKFMFGRQQFEGEIMYIGDREKEVLKELHKMKKKKKSDKRDSFHEDRPRKCVAKSKERAGMDGHRAETSKTSSKNAAKRDKEVKKIAAELALEKTLERAADGTQHGPLPQSFTTELDSCSSAISTGSSFCSTIPSPSLLAAESDANSRRDLKELERLSDRNNNSTASEGASEQMLIRTDSIGDYLEEADHISDSGLPLKPKHSDAPEGMLPTPTLMSPKEVGFEVEVSEVSIDAGMSNSNVPESFGDINVSARKEKKKRRKKRRKVRKSRKRSSSSSSISSSSSSSISLKQELPNCSVEARKSAHKKSKKEKKTKREKKYRKREISTFSSSSSDSTDSSTSSSSLSLDLQSSEGKKRKKKSKKVTRNMTVYPGQNYLYSALCENVVKLHPKYNVYCKQDDLDKSVEASKTAMNFVRLMVDKIYTREALENSTAQGFPARGRGKKAMRKHKVLPRLHPDGRSALLEKAVDIEKENKIWRPKAGERIKQAFRGRVGEF